LPAGDHRGRLHRARAAALVSMGRLRVGWQVELGLDDLARGQAVDARIGQRR